MKHKTTAQAKARHLHHAKPLKGSATADIGLKNTHRPQLQAQMNQGPGPKAKAPTQICKAQARSFSPTRATTLPSDHGGSPSTTIADNRAQPFLIPSPRKNSDLHSSDRKQRSDLRNCTPRGNFGSNVEPTALFQ